jgi:hypothetical protein
MGTSLLRRLIACLCLLGIGALPSSLRAQTTGTPLTLFNGTTLLGWTPNGPWTAGAGVLTSTSSGGNRRILTVVPFAALSLSFEYNMAPGMSAALRLGGSREGKGGFHIDLTSSGAPWGVGGIEDVARSKIASTSNGWHRAQVTFTDGHLKVQIDGNEAAEAEDLGSRAGYLGFDVIGTGAFQAREIRATPLDLKTSFNGTDLSGWKSIAHQPARSSGVGRTVEKTLTFGLGGNTKPHSANWTVRNGAIHGENGPGGLENANVYDDVILYLSATVQGGAVKREDFTGIDLRNTAGQLNGGYPVGIGSYSGAIGDFAHHGPVTGGSIDETVIQAGRTTAIWIGPNLATVYTDPRPEAGNVAQGAKTSAGALTFVLPNEKQSIDVQRISISSLPKSYGLAAKSAPPPAPAPVATPPAPPSPELATQTALLQQQQANAKQAEEADKNKRRSAALMNQALSAQSPQEQMSLYSEVIQIDPSNSAAVQGFRDAQAKVQAQQATKQNQATAQVVQQKVEASREQQTLDSLGKAQSAFLGGHFSEASSALSVAERLAPGNPVVRDLRSRINAASSLRTRVYFLAGGGGLLGLAGILTFFRHRRHQQRYPVLELIRGLDIGRRYPLDKDTVRIGAVPQDGGQKNDIVVRDVEHAVSRFHCELQRSNGHIYITDLNSSNGTRINGERLDPGKATLLRKGAKLDLGGSVELQLEYDRRPRAAPNS